MMSGPPELSEEKVPQLVNTRWKHCKTAIFKIASRYTKFILVRELLRLREQYTVAPNLSQITTFTGYDNAIHTIMRWDLNRSDDHEVINDDISEIGKLGAELMILHTLKESIRNNLLIWRDDHLRETRFGRVHFGNLNSFNVEITGSRIDIAKKRFRQERIGKQQRKMDPINNNIGVKRLYWENSILMLLRTPLTFYRTMTLLSPDQHHQLIDFHQNLLSRSNVEKEGLIIIRLTRGSRADKLMQVLTPPTDLEDRRPKFTAALQIPQNRDDEKVEYYVAIGALSMFVMFIMGFDKHQLDEKSKRAEKAVGEIVESTGYWKVLESNTDVVEAEGEVITEIDIIAQSVKTKELITIEVKDFAWWRGWIWNEGAENRLQAYKNAVDKLPIKEEFIKEMYKVDEIQSFIVTSLPESIQQLGNVSLVYLADLPEVLIRLAGQEPAKRQNYYGSNFLIRYFERLQMDYFNANKLQDPIITRVKDNDKLKVKLSAFKEDYEKLRNIYSVLNSEFETAKVSSKLAAKRLVKDTGEKHYQLEEDYNRLKGDAERIKRDLSVKAKALKEIKSKYNEVLEEIRSNEDEITRLGTSKTRLLAARLF